MSVEQPIILVVETDPAVLRLKRERLERAGYRVATAATAAETLRKVHDGSVNLLLFGQNLPPGVTGLELYRQITNVGFDIPVVLVTSAPDDHIALQSCRAGVRNVVPRANYLDHLLPLIERVLQHQRAEAIAGENLRLQSELCQAERCRDEFLAMLAHELRTPLAPIRNALYLIRLDPAGQQNRVEENWGIVERQVNHLVRLVEDLLDISRVRGGRIHLETERLRLPAIVGLAVESSRPVIVSRRHTLTVRQPPDELAVDGDPVRLVQVLVNLLDNAAKYTPEGGRIELTVEQQERWAVLRVRDTGQGIAPDLLPRLFDLFTQSERTLDRSAGGLGIGLSLARQLTELHGGSVEAFSAGPGKGSEFVVRLPLASSGPGPTVVPAEAPAGPRRRVLVVDDNRDSARTLTRLLEMLGHETHAAHDGAGALAEVVAYRPEVVLLDIGLPGMNGYDVCRELRSRPDFDQTVLVALTGYGDAKDRQASLRAGFNAHLVKPVELEELKQLLANPQLLLEPVAGETVVAGT